jgi:DNA mismatch repair protein MutS2
LPPAAFSPVAGQSVRILNLQPDGVVGTIVESPKPGQAQVLVAVGGKGVRVMADVNQLAPAPAGAASASQDSGIRVTAYAGEGLALNLVGMRVEEALEEVDRAIDQAVLAGRGAITIIHGLGTGRLKQSVREFLSAHPFVADYQSPTRQFGSSGITIANLKD